MIKERLEKYISNILCKIGYHEWHVPNEDMLGESYKRYGVRRCITCNREEKLLIKTNGEIEWYKTNGEIEWYCPKEKISKAFAKIRKGN